VFWAACWQHPTSDSTAKSQDDFSLSRIATRNLALGLVPLLVAVEALHLPPAWGRVGMATLILSALCYAARLILGEYREARSALDLQRTLAALSASQENYRRFVSQSSEGIFRTECTPPLDLSLPASEQIAHCLKHARIAESNEALAQMLSAQRAADLVDKRLGEWMPQYLSSFRALLEHLVESGFRVADYEFRLQDASGNQRVLRLSLSGLVESGKLGQAWGILRDVTENVRLEAQLRQTQKMDALGRLAGGVAHDFNNILSVISGYCELSHPQVDPYGPVSKNLNHIKRAADRAVALTRQLLSFCRKQVVFPRAVDLNELVRNSEEMLHRLLGEDISLTFAATIPLGQVRADPGQLEQVLMNLVINARDAMPRGGQILVSTAEAELDAGTSQDQNPIKSGTYVLLVVSDSGVGMTDEVKSHLFEPFFTTKGQGKGTGLGLSTVHGIIQQAGGHIWVYSEPGRGSTFKVYLPRLEQKVAGPSLPEPQAEPAGGSETILLVEDDQAVRKLTASMLRGAGYHVLEAGDANAAIRVFRDSADRINLLLTDVMMPGLSGVELASQLRKTYPALKVLYVSGYSGDRIANAEQFQDGFSFLEKPFARNSLLSRLRLILDASVAANHEQPAKPAS
jgi:signal transduction histidine kinase/CheY-like chemotaxis protein